VTRRDGVTTPVEEAAAPRRGKGADGASWIDANLTWPKNEENLHGRFSWYK
jgi:hypothetical protein